jgi:hypothetical protein
MSFPRINPRYMETPLKELQKAHAQSIKSNEKSSSPRKSPKKESPKSSSVKKRIRDAPLHTSVVSPRPNYHYINDINGPNENIKLSLINPNYINSNIIKMPEIKSTTKRKHERKFSLPDVITDIHGTHFINEKTKLPPIGKKGGKRRTRKHKSILRKTLRKNK